MAPPTMANVVLPNNKPHTVAPVAMIASKATNSLFIRLFCLLVTIYAAKVLLYFIYAIIIDYFFHLIFSGAKRPFLCSSVFLCSYFCPNCKQNFHSL